MSVGMDGEVCVLISGSVMSQRELNNAHQNTIDVSRVEPEEDAAKSSKGTLWGC